MCVVAVKYLKDYGWVGAKNRDRNYQVNLDIVKSRRGGMQRIYIDDATTRWTEGLNEYGTCIISASLSVKSDEKEGDKFTQDGRRRGKKNNLYSPQGLAIRRALLKDNLKDSLESLVNDELTGCTFVFNAEECYILEAGYNLTKEKATKDNPRMYLYHIKEIPKDADYAVRTNHGVSIRSLGYSQNGKDEFTTRARESSERRREIVNNLLGDKKIVTPHDVLDVLSSTPDDDPFMNPIRLGDPKRGDMVTTGQIMLVPSECTLHYRPLFSKVSFDYSKINAGEENKVFFEIVSSRKLLSFKEKKS